MSATPQGKARHGQNIQVYVRVRPLNHDERQARSASIVSCPGPREISVQEKPFSHITKTFNFDKVFSDTSAQPDVTKVVVSPLIKQVLKGYNCTVFAYGQTGTGKTYTMEGLKDYDGCWEKDPDAGIIPRSLIEIFEAKKKGGFDDDCFQIKVSFLELYNEDIFDLLCKGMDLDRKYKIFEDSAKKGSVIVQGLEERVVKSKEQVLKIMEEGSLKRTTAATKMNASSSRSHTIFTITVTITEKSIVGQEKYTEGKLNLVDLAGSENIGRSGAVDKRAREAGKINESLLTLGRVINSLVKKESHIPYRESKLTRLLQDSLGGRTKTSIIATVSPASINLEETLSTLDYAHRAKNITNRPEVNQKIPVASKLAEMQHRVDQIRRELEEQREQDGGVFMSQEKKQELERKSLELENLRKEFRDLSGLFDLKTSENEKLKDDLTDTIKQLEDKALMLQKTQEEKEVQEHLVSRHKDTESKIKGQAFELREVADQQYSDLDKLHDSRDRKGKLEAFNSKVTSNYQFETADRFGRMERIVDDRADIHGKMCTIVKDSHDHVVKKNEDFTQKTVEDLAKANGDVKEIMSVLDGLSGGHMKAEQTFLSASLADAQSKMSERSTALQNHLKKTLSVTQDVGTAVSRQQKAIDDMVGSFKQHISMDDSLISAFVKSLKDLLDATDKKHDDNFIKAKRLNQANLDEIQDFKHTIETEKKKMENELSEMATQLTAKRDAYSSLFSGLDARLDTIRANVAAAQTEQSEANELVAAAHNTLVQKAHAVDSEKASLSTRALGQLADTYDDVSASLNAMQTGMAGLDDEEKNFVSREQEIERTKYEEMERAFRTRSDEAPKQMQALQEKTREVQKISSESLSAHEMASESHQSQLVRWRDNHAVDFDGVCEQVGEMDTKLRKEIDGAREREKKYFNDDLRKDQPTGKTPGRVNRSYPKDIVEGTPDDVRVRRFRQSRDLTAAMKLKIDDLDSDDETDENAGDKSGNDSVFSASTAVTADSVSRQNSRENVSMMTNTSKEEEEEAAESEHGYASDAENKAPKSASVSGGDVASGKFAIPGSKLKMPKSYPASTSGSTSNVSARSRSSSRTRTRNVLGSAN